MTDKDLTEAIMDVWGDYDDFDSLDYIGWVIEKDAREIRNSDWENAEVEFADIAICALRALAEEVDDPEEVILERLEDRMEGQQEVIIARDKYQYHNE